ncbi:hypothetical protein, partial [Klebsiella pneumoniae]|uniref:hypothetical protein n=1 Tax=Klebsiella pneumoniae TaxID=573 RepID=UPI0040558333
NQILFFFLKISKGSRLSSVNIPKPKFQMSKAMQSAFPRKITGMLSIGLHAPKARRGKGKT